MPWIFLEHELLPAQTEESEHVLKKLPVDIFLSVAGSVTFIKELLMSSVERACF